MKNHEKVQHIAEEPVVESWSQRLKRYSDKLMANFKRKETEIAGVTLTEEAKNRLNILVTESNPDWAMLPFIGVGNGTVVEQIISSSPFVTNTQLEPTSMINVDPNQLEALLREVLQKDLQDKIICIGFTYPSGEIKRHGITYTLDPSDTHLELTGGAIGRGKKYNEGGMISAFRDLRNNNPNLPFSYTALAAQTPDGPKIKLHRVSDLERVLNFRDLDKIFSQIIDL